MNHYSEETIVDYLEGELDRKQQHIVELHILSCIECQQLVATYSKFRDQLAVESFLEDSDRFVADVMHQVVGTGGKQESRSSFYLMTQWLPQCFVSAAAALVIWMQVFQPTSSEFGDIQLTDLSRELLGVSLEVDFNDDTSLFDWELK